MKSTPNRVPRLGKRQTVWNRWVELNNPRSSRKLTASAVEQYLVALDSPLAADALRCWKTKDHEKLARMSIDPLKYHIGEEERFRRDYLAVKFLKKAQFLTTSINVERVALERFMQSEVRCEQTNWRFGNLNKDRGFGPLQAKILGRAWSLINKVIGDGPSLDEFFSLAAWGPGVTQQLKGKRTSATNKFDAERTATTALWTFVLPFWKWAYPHWSLDTFTYSDVCKIITVPKSAITDRTIGEEPGLNTWYQKSLGLWLRNQLRLVAGIDLNSGQGLHALLARKASISGEFATVDFSDASDLIANKVVELLLSSSEGAKRFYKLLSLCRTPLYELDGEVRITQKFSSMGNGFTFELETLIFWAIAQATTDVCESNGKVSVYGDDVILPTEACSTYLSVCMWFGFKPNKEKSYASGLFRESCGAHFFNGVDCKPIQIEELLHNGKKTIIFANQVRLVAHRLNFGDGCYSGLESLWRFVVSNIPVDLRLGAPVNAVIPFRVNDRSMKMWISKSGSTRRSDSLWSELPSVFKRNELFTDIGIYTDGALIMNFDEAQPAMAREMTLKSKILTPNGYKRVWHTSLSTGVMYYYDVQQYKEVSCSLSPKGWEGWLVKCFSESPVKEFTKSAGLYLARLKIRSEDKAHGNAYELRDSTTTRYSEFVVSSWNDLGPWKLVL